jgi:hypothetical protein
VIKFMVLSAPRSASTWVANWLTTDKTLCLHDPILEYSPEDLDLIPCDRMLGVACTGLGLLTDFVNAHPALKVIVHRDLGQVNESLVSIGLSALGARWLSALDRIRGVHVCYEQLFDPHAAEQIQYQLTGLPFDAARHAQLCAMHVEPHFEKIQVKPDRARDFRARVDRAFH